MIPNRNIKAHMGASLNGGTPKSSILDWYFPWYIIQLLGYLHLWKPPYQQTKHGPEGPKSRKLTAMPQGTHRRTTWGSFIQPQWKPKYGNIWDTWISNPPQLMVFSGRWKIPVFRTANNLCPSQAVFGSMPMFLVQIPTLFYFAMTNMLYVCSQAMIWFSLHVWQSHRWFACWKLQLLGSKCFCCSYGDNYICTYLHIHICIYICIIKINK